jgi:hypothetical protein
MLESSVYYWIADSLGLVLIDQITCQYFEDTLITQRILFAFNYHVAQFLPK